MSPEENRFYAAVLAVVADAGSPTPSEISKMVSERTGCDVSESTIRGWICQKHLPRSTDDLLAVVKALGAERHSDWELLLRSAKKGKEGRTKLEAPMTDAQPADPPGGVRSGAPADERKTDTARRRLVLTGCGALAVALFIALWLSTSISTGPAGAPESRAGASPHMTQRSAQACVDVVSAVAYVYPAPGANPYEKIAKYRGAHIMLYPDVPDTTGPDGRRYRAIRSPARANPGMTPFSWMLADQIVTVPCSPL